MTTKFIIKMEEETIEFPTTYGWLIALKMLELINTTKDKPLTSTDRDYQEDFLEREISRCARILIEQIEGVMSLGLIYDATEFDSDIVIERD